LISKLYRGGSEFKQKVLYCAVGLYVILLLYSAFRTENSKRMGWVNELLALRIIPPS
jgi:hypothetical protein